LVAVRDLGGGYRFPDALGDDPRVVERRAASHHDELLTPIAPDHVILGRDHTEDLHHAFEGRVARQVTVSVVDALEVIEVDDDHRERRAAPDGGREIRSEPRFELPAVEDAGEPVADARLVHTGERLLLLGVDEVEAQRRAGAEAHPIAVLEPSPRYARVVDVGAVERSIVLDDVSGSLTNDAGVNPGERHVVELHAARASAAQRPNVAEQRMQAPGLAPAHADEHASIARRQVRDRNRARRAVARRVHLRLRRGAC
jgi:hypothetical protein